MSVTTGDAITGPGGLKPAIGVLMNWDVSMHML